MEGRRGFHSWDHPLVPKDDVRFVELPGYLDTSHEKAVFLHTVPFVNGRSLIDWVKEVEVPFATAEGFPELAGEYVGMSAEEVFLPSRHLLGAAIPNSSMAPDRPYLLDCAHRDTPGCWPFVARVVVLEEVVIWRDFVQPYRVDSRPGHPRWTYDALGQFVFDRKAYEQALVRSSRPGPQPPQVTRPSGFRPGRG